MPDQPKTQQTKAIALVVYPGAQMSAILGLMDLFQVANARTGHDGPRMEARMISFPLAAENADTRFDAIVLPPNLTGARGETDVDIHRWIRSQHAAGAIACSVCAGAFWLGRAGLLDGRPATTHWVLEGEFRAAFPRARLAPELLLIDDHDVVSAGGLMAWLDLGLHIVERWLGPQAVTLTARHLLIDPHGREQRNYRSFRPVFDHGDRAVLALQRWMEGNAGADLGIEALADRSGLATRTFTRRFKAATGLAPSQYVQNLRIERARGMLERTRQSAAEVALEVGYSDFSAFSRIFKAVTGLSASAYRTRFRVPAEPGAMRDREG